MAEPNDKPWYTRLPAVSVGVLAFLVGLTTLANNVRGWLDDDVPAVTAPPSASTNAAEAAPVPVMPTRLTMLVTLERIEVLNDGTVGSTAWSFEIEGGGETLFTLPARDYSDDEPGRNVTPRSSDPSIGRVVLVPGQEMLIKVSGSMSGLLRGRTAVGTSTLSAAGHLPPIRVMAGPEGTGGSFVFHFSAASSAGP